MALVLLLRPSQQQLCLTLSVASVAGVLRQVLLLPAHLQSSGSPARESRTDDGRSHARWQEIIGGDTCDVYVHLLLSLCFHLILYITAEGQQSLSLKSE